MLHRLGLAWLAMALCFFIPLSSRMTTPMVFYNLSSPATTPFSCSRPCESFIQVLIFVRTFRVGFILAIVVGIKIGLREARFGGYCLQLGHLHWIEGRSL
ncbi:hypothetical protein DFH94DRAFT_784098 [Russula ochroleuca]|uniref:Secreted peptide n=1 Tax=Russula ochroleuca TaxID=152965 RepID=A0A9P5JW04_9AGAM|nr:hypothetical protein DFH94DRAFT_784098 [Russula ochroleuca]